VDASSHCRPNEAEALRPRLRLGLAHSHGPGPLGNLVSFGLGILEHGRAGRALLRLLDHDARRPGAAGRLDGPDPGPSRDDGNGNAGSKFKRKRLQHEDGESEPQ